MYGGITGRTGGWLCLRFLECAMNHERKKINVSNSHVALRTVAFVLAVVLGVAGISIGISSIGKREPGYYEILRFSWPSGKARNP